MRDTVLKIAWLFYGHWYLWGGDDPAGFDCSGLVCECMQAIGQIHRSHDHTAQSMWDLWRAGRRPTGLPGDLVFWYDNTGKRVIHVEIVVSDSLSIGASGGGSSCKTIEDAKRLNAFIKVRPWASRANVAGFINPYNQPQI